MELSMIIEKKRNVFLKITGFVIGFAATFVALIVAVLLGATGFLLIITGGIITLTLAIFRKFKKLTSEIEDLKIEINKLKEKK